MSEPAAAAAAADDVPPEHGCSLRRPPLSWTDTKNFGMTLIDTFDFPHMKFSVYTLATLPPGEAYALTPGTAEAHLYKWNHTGTSIEMVYNYGTEADDSKYHPGNAEGDGFGHIAFNVADVYAACAELETNGVTFKKKPDEGRMKGLAFAYDPDGYWIEIVRRGEEVRQLTTSHPP